MKRITYVAALSTMVVLVFAVVAWAQDSSKEQGGSDSNGSAEQAQSPAPSKQEATPSDQTSPAQDALTVSILANAFDPPQLDVAPGSTVTFKNEDAVAHTVALEGLFDSYEIAPGSTYPVWLGGGPGTVAYHDKAKPAMRGTITVGGGADQGGATTPAEPAGEEASQTGGEKTTQTGGESTQAADDVSTEQNQDSAKG